MMTNRQPEEWETLETDLHRQMYAYYRDVRAISEHDGDAHGTAVFGTSVKFKMKNAEMQNIASMLHWDERYNREYLKLPADTSLWTKDDYRKFVKDAVEKINKALQNANLENGITSAKDLKAATDALEKLTRLDLNLMGEASERISIDINKRPDEMTDKELEDALERLQKRLPVMRAEKKETEEEEEEEEDEEGGETG